MLWSGSVPTLRHPALIARLGVIHNIYKYNRLYLPTEVLSFDSVSPLNTQTDLPLVVSNADEDDSVSRRLALTRRAFYRAFGSDQYEEAMDVGVNYSKVADLFFVGRSKLLRPLYPSKSMVMASNLLNNLFETLFTHMRIPLERHEEFFEAMCNVQPPFGEQFETITTSAHGINFLNALFPQNLALVKPTLEQTPFTDLWRYAVGSLSAINA